MNLTCFTFAEKVDDRLLGVTLVCERKCGEGQKKRKRNCSLESTLYAYMKTHTKLYK
jgi:hypothetical protein